MGGGAKLKPSNLGSGPAKVVDYTKLICESQLRLSWGK